MKKRVVSLLALLLCAVFVLGSCGTTPKAPEFAEFFTGSNHEAEVAYATFAQIADLDDATYVTSEGNLALFSKADATGTITYTVYNAATGATVLKVANTATLINEIELVELYYDSWYHIDENALILVTSTDTANNVTTTKLYDVAGAQVGDAAKGEEYAESYLDLVLFNDIIYREADGKLTEIKKVNPLGREYPEFDEYNELYYYHFSSEGAEIYSATDLSLVSIIPFSTKYSAKSNWHVLQNGNVIFQGAYRLPDDAAEYDFLMDEQKLAFDTFIYDAATGEGKEIDFDYYIYEGVYVSNDPWTKMAIEQGYIPTMAEFENIFPVIPFVDEHLEENEYLTELYLVDNDGKIKGTLSEYLPAGNTDLPHVAPQGKFFLNDMSGNKYLVGADGTVIGECNTSWTNENYIVAGGKIFDWSLTELFDYEAKDYELVSILADTVLLKKEVKNAEGSSDEYGIYKDGGVVTVIAADKKATVTGTYRNFFTASYYDATALKTVYLVYSSNGTQLTSMNTPLTMVDMFNDAAIFKTVVPAADSAALPKTVYYRITK